MRRTKAELLDPIPDLVTIDPQQLAGVRLVPRRAFERLDDQLSLDIFQIDALRRQPEHPSRRRLSRERRKILRRQPLAIDEKHGALNRIAKLTDVARPPVLFQQRQSIGVQAAYLLPKLTIEPLDVVIDQQPDVAVALPERRE